MLSRRTTLLSALAAGAGALSVSAASASASASTASAGSGAARFNLPRPSGPWPVGASAYRLVDETRSDPWVTAPPYRELMVSVRYPAARTAGMPAAPQFLPGEAAGFAAANNLSGVPGDAVDWAATRTHARQEAPVARQGGPFPVVLYSPGVLDPRSLNSTLCDDLASRGYVVVTVDHTYEATAVEFPGGRVATTVIPAEFAATGQDPVKVIALLEKVTAVRVADTRFVLDRMPALLRRAVGGAADPHQVGMFGHSAGGFTALETMYEDSRIRAGVNLDGVLAYVTDDADPGNLSPVAAHGLDRPFLLAGSDTDDLDTEPAWASLWRRSTGWHRGFRLEGAAHASYTDVQSIVPQLAKPLGLSVQTVESNVGTISPRASIAAQRAYLAAFFDRHLRGRPDRGLFDMPSARYPGVHLFS
ncbi:alpha/beta hydrolase family protein [Streptomyces sp. NBC_00370]|uniref:alpha/beta hydrolase family protein n=1 Tax=Streptomyces sp. NBC_00370 TaxID=2975728 RepID=UPI002E267627